MVGSGHHIKEGPHRSESFATCGRILDDGGFLRDVMIYIFSRFGVYWVISKCLIQKKNWKYPE